MKKFLALALALALSLCLFGCATSSRTPTPQKVAEVVYATDLRAELFPLMEEGSKLVIMDWRFVALPERRTRELIHDALFKFDSHYVVEARDCDDLAVEATVRIRELFRKETHNLECAAPVGVVGGALTGDLPELKIFMHGRIGYHAMCAVRCAEGRWLLVEPSTKRIVDLSSPIYEGCFEMFLGVF